MTSTFATWLRQSATLALGLLVTSAFAQSPPDALIDLPAGSACPGFDLRLEVRGTTQQNRLFTDRNGNPVRFLSVGKGSALTFINLNNGNTISLRPNAQARISHLTPTGRPP